VTSIPRSLMSADPEGKGDIYPIVEESVKEALCLESVGPDQTLTDLGADSLDLLQILTELEERVRRRYVPATDRQSFYNAFGSLKSIHNGNAGKLTAREIATYISSILPTLPAQPGVDHGQPGQGMGQDTRSCR